jgi:hypothetical protein
MSTPGRSRAIEMPYGMPNALASSRADRAAELRIAVATMAFASGVVHLSLVAPHVRQSVALAVLFSLAGAGEIGWSVMFVRSRSRSGRLASCGAALLLCVAVGWLLSRTVGLPFGIDPGPSEPFGVLDCLTTGCELFALYALSGRRSPARSPWVVYAGVTLAVLLLLALATLGHHAVS